MLRLFFAGILPMLPSCVFAQYTGAYFTALAHCGAAQMNVWSVTENAAGLTGLSTPTIALNYENLYAIPGMGVKSLVAAMPFSRYALGGYIQELRFDTYSHFNTGMAFARSFGNFFSLALTLKYRQTGIRDYGNIAAISFDTGLQYRPNDQITFGLQISNPLSSQSQKPTYADKLFIPQMRLGMGWQSSKELMLLAEIEKSGKAFYTGKIALSYDLFALLSLRGGISLRPFSQYAGFGLNWKSFAFDAAFSAHPNLGYSPAFGIEYAF